MTDFPRDNRCPAGDENPYRSPGMAPQRVAKTEEERCKGADFSLLPPLLVLMFLAGLFKTLFALLPGAPSYAQYVVDGFVGGAAGGWICAQLARQPSRVALYWAMVCGLVGMCLFPFIGPVVLTWL